VSTLLSLFTWKQIIFSVGPGRTGDGQVWLCCDGHNGHFGGVVAEAALQARTCHDLALPCINDQNDWRTLSSVSTSMSYVAMGVQQVLLHFNWTRVAVVRQGAQCDLAMNGLTASLAASSARLVSLLYANFSDADSLKNALAQLRLVARGVIL